MQITTVDALVRTLHDSKLFTQEQLLVIVRELAQYENNFQPVLKHLVERKHLTVYQLRKVVHNKAEDLFLGPYIVVDKLGEGGMGRVYRARHVRVGREVALKIVRPNLLSNPIIRGRYEREVEAAGTLRHANIVCVEDAGEVNGKYYMAMEFVDGVDLARLIRDHNKLEVPEACEYVRQAALGLQHAHENGFVHRDIKPSNIIVSGERHVPHAGSPALVKILDMGLVRPMGFDDVPGAAELTRAGTVVGTPDYMSPEQAKNSSDVDPRADLYSLGCTLYFLLTGQVPFPDGTPIEKLLKHQLDPTPKVKKLRPEVPDVLDAIVTKLTAKKREDRYETAAEVAELLGSLSAYSRGVIPNAPRAATPSGAVPVLPPPAVSTTPSTPQFVQNPGLSGKMRPVPMAENPGLSGKMRPVPMQSNPGLSGRLPATPAMQNPGLSGKLAAAAPPPSRPVPVVYAPQPVHPSDPTPRPPGVPGVLQTTVDSTAVEAASPFATLQDPPSVPLGLVATDTEEPPRPNRRTAPAGPPTGLLIGGVIGGVLILIILVVALSGRGGKPTTPSGPTGPNPPDSVPPPKRYSIVPKLDQMGRLHHHATLVPDGTGLVVVVFPATYLKEKDSPFVKGTGPTRLNQWVSKLATDTAVQLPRTDRLVLSVPAASPGQYSFITEGDYLGGNFAQSLATHPKLFSLGPFAKLERPMRVFAAPENRHVAHIAATGGPPVFAVVSNLPLLEKLRVRLMTLKTPPAPELDQLMLPALNVVADNPPLLFAVAGKSYELPFGENPTLESLGLDLLTLKVQIHDKMEIELTALGEDADAVKKALKEISQMFRVEKFRWGDTAAEMLLRSGTADRHDGRYRWTIKTTWTAEQFSTFVEHCFGQ